MPAQFPPLECLHWADMKTCWAQAAGAAQTHKPGQPRGPAGSLSGWPPPGLCCFHYRPLSWASPTCAVPHVPCAPAGLHPGPWTCMSLLLPTCPGLPHHLGPGHTSILRAGSHSATPRPGSRAAWAPALPLFLRPARHLAHHCAQHDAHRASQCQSQPLRTGKAG